MASLFIPKEEITHNNKKINLKKSVNILILNTQLHN